MPQDVCNCYNRIMNMLPATLVALSLFDFLPVSAPPSVVPIESLSPVGKGELSVIVTPADSVGTVQKGATRIAFLTLDLSASCDADVALSEITVTHAGLGRATDIAAVYVSDGLRRLSRAQRFDARSGTATLRLQGVTVSRCGALHLTLRGDIAVTADTAGEHSLGVLRPEDVVSSAKRTVLRFTDESERIFTAPGKQGTITVRSLPVAGLLRYGRTETVARLQFTADASAAHLLKHLTLTNRGDARDYDLVRFQIVTRSGDILTPMTHHMDARSVTLDFVPSYILPRGQTMVLLVQAEVRSARGKKVEFVLEEPADLQASVYQDR